ncbi:hypothetical protein [Algoriphagus halophilus]|uniref:TerB family tellurite resistance protein n=1 Tax=Algoriphagus halophilus TaxID=226505 RepID=A0A1N6E6Y3_9BACT|nr:hypothetical protein [Algoriphagus halophilus]SIN78741.1 hypothetical protein SAMN05444394_1785 [Algoriphagus halophilus]
MKILLLFLSLGISALPSHSQTFQEWWNQKKTQQKYLAEQIAALQAYGRVLKEGYEVVSQGLDLIRSITGEDMALHQTHFTSFSTINPHLRDHHAIEKTSLLYAEINQLNQLVPNKYFRQFLFTDAEEKFILQIVQGLKEDSDQLFESQQNLLAKDLLNLNDTDRMEQLTQIQLQMQKIHAAALQLFQDCQSLGYSRQRAIQALEQRKKIHVH